MLIDCSRNQRMRKLTLLSPVNTRLSKRLLRSETNKAINRLQCRFECVRCQICYSTATKLWYSCVQREWGASIRVRSVGSVGREGRGSQVKGGLVANPNFSTDNSFSNPWKSIRDQSILSPLYLSNDLYRVGCRHKCPQHHRTQKRYFSLQFPKRRLIHESTQGRLSLWSRVGTTSFPHHLIFITQCGLFDMSASRKMTRPY